MGNGAEVKDAEVILMDEEDVLWRMGTLGTSSPSSLMNAILFCNGKILCLRDGEEHRSHSFSLAKMKKVNMLFLLKTIQRMAVEATRIKLTTK